MEQHVCDTYVRILKNELIVALGCTEPIAIAYAGALARKVLGLSLIHIYHPPFCQIFQDADIKKATQLS